MSKLNSKDVNSGHSFSAAYPLILAAASFVSGASTCDNLKAQEGASALNELTTVSIPAEFKNLLPVKSSLISGAEKVQKLELGKPIEDFTFVDSSGRILKLSEIARDRIILIHVWSPSCGPCLAEIPSLISQIESINSNKIVNPADNTKLKGMEVLSISVNYDQDQEVRWQRKISNELKNEYIIHAGIKDIEMLKLLYDITGTPSIILVDNNLKLLGKNPSIRAHIPNEVLLDQAMARNGFFEQK